MVYDAIVLAGARSRRLGGADKAIVEVGGRTLLARAVEAMTGAERVVVVGPRRPLGMDVAWVQEQPAGAGPVAALAAGLGLVEAPFVAVLAVDLPFVDRGVVRAMVEAVGRADGAILSDGSACDQPLAGVYRTMSLRERMDRLVDPDGVAVRTLVSGMSLHRIPSDRAAADCDTWEEVARAGRALGAP